MLQKYISCWARVGFWLKQAVFWAFEGFLDFKRFLSIQAGDFYRVFIFWVAVLGLRKQNPWGSV